MNILQQFDNDEITRNTLHNYIVTAILINFPVEKRNRISYGRGIPELADALIEAYLDGKLDSGGMELYIRREIDVCKGFYLFTPT